ENPTAPTVLSELELGEQGRRILISGNRAFIAFKEIGVKVIGLGDLRAISEITTMPTVKGAMGLAMIGETLLVADYTAGLSLVDTTMMTITNNLDTPGVAMNVVVGDGRAWVADYSGGIRQFDLSDSANPVTVAPAYETAGWINSVSIGSEKIAIAGTAGLGLIDKHDLAALPDLDFVSVRSQGVDRTSTDVVLDNARAYLIDERTGMQIYDVTDSPVELATFTIDRPKAIAIDDGIVYLANNSGLLVLDAGILPPIQLQSVSHEWNPSGMLVVGQALYVADQDQGVWVYDVSNPARPVQTGYWDRPAWGLALGQNFLVSAAGSKGLRTAAIGDPLRPIEIGRWVTEDARSVVVVGQVAYLADMETGIHVIGLQDPVDPIQIGILDTPGSSQDIAGDGEYVYVADSAGGLLIYRRE
ncbi:MAG: hypothetical protein JXA42_12895, partial [Anaerolineales bacterium]|nr:hypothetical protein [Anaerolineales bacterium]